MSFKDPNYTQVPNDFFDMIPDMTDAELRVTLALVRQTFGFHRPTTTMGFTDLESSTGLSNNGVRAGAEAAENRGTFRRLNPDTKTKAEWELVVEPAASDPQPVRVDPQPVRKTPSASEPQVGTKERKKVIKKKGDYLDLLLANAEPTAKDLRVQEMYDKMDRLFRTTFSRNKNTDVVVKFVLAREELGESLERFVQWAQRDEFNASRLWEYAENPIKIKTRWQIASSYAGGSYDGAIEGV